MKESKITVIGAGNVGSSVAYALILKNIASHIVLIDIDTVRCKGELLDLSDAMPFCRTSELTTGTTKDARDADIIIICAGKAQKPGESRTDLLQANKKIIESIFKDLKPINKNAIVIIVSNPVDILTYHAQQLSGLPKNQVFGSGTLLDTQRLLGILSKRLGIAEQSIDAYVIGEHGDSQVCAWSLANVAGIPLTNFKELKKGDYKKIEDEVKNQAYEIISCKGSTHYGIATCVASICETIMYDQKGILPLSTFIPEFDVCFSMPAVLGKNGIERVLYPKLSNDEQEKLKQSASKLKKIL